MGKRILAVEDDPDILFIVEYLLHENGYDVVTSPDGENILELVEEVQPDLVLMDIRLPNADGRQLCKVIRGKTKSIPIILMSANTEYEVILKDNCANDFIAKPFDINTMLSKIEKQLAA